MCEWNMAQSDDPLELDRQLQLADAELTILVSEMETDGRVSLIEATAGPDAETVPHWHAETIEAFYVLDGSLTLYIDEDEHTLDPGDSFVVPPRTMHAPVNTSEEPCRHLLLLTPGAFEGFFRGIAQAYATADDWPPDDDALLEDVFEHYDIREPPIASSEAE